MAEVFWFGRDLDVKDLKPKRFQVRNKSVWLRRLVSANVGQWLDTKEMSYYLTYFVTLTFAENLTDLTNAHSHFMRFIKRLGYKFSFQPAYVCVPEFQQRGAVHYHVLFFNLPRYDYPRYMADIWTHGYVILKPVETFENVAWYMAKYMSKNNADKRFEGRKRYFASRNVFRPRVSYSELFVIDFLEAMFEGSRRLHSEYQSEFTGLTKYEVYDISEHPIRYAYALLPHEKFKNDDDYVEAVDKNVDNELLLWKTNS